MGKFVIICKVYPKDGVVSFFLQQSVLLADSTEFLPGLSWRLFTKIFPARNSGWSESAGEREEGGGWTEFPGLGYSALSRLQSSSSPLGLYPGLWLHRRLLVG